MKDMDETYVRFIEKDLEVFWVYIKRPINKVLERLNMKYCSPSSSYCEGDELELGQYLKK